MAQPRRSARLGSSSSTTCTPTPQDDSPRALRAAKRRRLSGPAPPQLQLPLGSIAMPGSSASPVRAKRGSPPPRSPLSSPPLSPVNPRKENVVDQPLRRSPRKSLPPTPRVSPRRAHLPPLPTSLPTKPKRAPSFPVHVDIKPKPKSKSKSKPKKKAQRTTVDVNPIPVESSSPVLQLDPTPLPDPVEQSPLPSDVPPPPDTPLPPDYQYAYEAFEPQPQQYHQQPLHERQHQYQIQPHRRERDSLKLWKAACRGRVDVLQTRYTPLTIRDLVAQEAQDYFLRHGQPKPWNAQRVGRIGSDDEEERVDDDHEDWSEYESELSDEDDEDDEDDYDDDGSRPLKRSRATVEEDDDDEDADGDVDPEAYAHDPSFNAELSSALHDGRRRLRGPQVKPRGSSGDGVGAHLGAFYVPLDKARESPPHFTSPPASPSPPPRSHSPFQQAYPYPYSSYPHHESTLPVPPPRLSTIPAIALKGIEMTATGLIGRGTPVDRARKAMWGWGVVPGDVQYQYQRGRASLRVKRGRTVLGDMSLGMTSPTMPMHMPMTMSMPVAQEPDQVAWDAFFESLKREDIDVPMESPTDRAASPHPHSHSFDMMGMGMNMNVNMNINMNMNMGGLFSSPSPPPMSTSPPPPPSPVSPTDFEMFNVGFGVGVGVGIGMAVGAGAGAGWSTPPPTSPVPSNTNAPGDFGMDMGMPVSPVEGFDVPSSSTLSFALG